MIAVTHPGKLGDALYTLPVIRSLFVEKKMQTDFYTSEECRPVLKLMEYQEEVRCAFVSESYKALHDLNGIQPWEVPVDRTAYELIVHCGYRNKPNCFLPEYMAKQVGAAADKLPDIYYEFPTRWLAPMKRFEPYIAVAPRGRGHLGDQFRPDMLDLITNSPINVVQIGGVGDDVARSGINGRGRTVIDATGTGLFPTLPILEAAVGFIGLMSANLVLANGFEIPKVVLHDGHSWDMTHVMWSERHHYLVHPLQSEVWEALGL